MPSGDAGVPGQRRFRRLDSWNFALQSAGWIVDRSAVTEFRMLRFYRRVACEQGIYSYVSPLALPCI
jgi:hypothetical protein